jgi:hypothetical protein
MGDPSFIGNTIRISMRAVGPSNTWDDGLVRIRISCDFFFPLFLCKFATNLKAGDEKYLNELHNRKILTNNQNKYKLQKIK